MSDEADKAVDQEERILERRLATRPTPAININNYDKQCIQCGAGVDSVDVKGTEIFPRWCSHYCRNEWSTDNE
jgi:hypothetical protein